jgi:hypothetical protein
MISRLAMRPVNGFEHCDLYQFGCVALLAAGDLSAAAGYAAREAELPFYRDEDYLGLARRLKVDALAGNFDAVLCDAERFHSSWKRDGQPVVPSLGSCAYAVAMVHGILGNEAGRAGWARITDHLIGGQPAITTAAWRATFDAIVDLHRADFDAALLRLAVDIDDTGTWWRADPAVFRPWYAAAWAEAAVFAHTADAQDRIRRARRATSDNPITTAIVERAAAIAAGDRPSVERLAAVFATLGSPYQHARTETLARKLG